MLGIQDVSVVVIAVVFCVAKGYVVPAGKCDTNRIQTCYVLERDYRFALNMPMWKLVYGTYAEEFRQIDQASATFSRNDNRTHTAHVQIILRNITSNIQDYVLTFNETVITEESYVNETGELHQFKIYPLAITRENALLFYRCSKSGGVSVDTRYIVIPSASTLSEESLRQLTEEDKKQDFQGELINLPYEIKTRLSQSPQSSHSSDSSEDHISEENTVII